MIHQSKKNQIYLKKLSPKIKQTKTLSASKPYFLTNQKTHTRHETFNHHRLLPPTPNQYSSRPSSHSNIKHFKSHEPLPKLFSNKLLTQSKKCIKITVLKDQKEN